jgi:hypothetical protein
MIIEAERQVFYDLDQVERPPTLAPAIVAKEADKSEKVVIEGDLGLESYIMPVQVTRDGC